MWLFKNLTVSKEGRIANADTGRCTQGKSPYPCMLLGLIREDHALQHINPWNIPDLSEEETSTRTAPSVPAFVRRDVHR